MIKNLFTLPGMERSVLSCVWIDTGNPAQPLACVWIDRDLRIATDDEENEQEERPLCACGRAVVVLRFMTWKNRMLKSAPGARIPGPRSSTA
jgi:hypothetical protein